MVCILILTVSVPAISFQTVNNQTQQPSLTTDQQEQLSSSSTLLSTNASNMNSDSTSSPQTSNKSFNNYTNPILGISLQIPSDWFMVEDPIMNRVTFIAPSNISGTDLPEEYLQIKFVPSENLTLDE